MSRREVEPALLRGDVLRDGGRGRTVEQVQDPYLESAGMPTGARVCSLLQRAQA